jgi:hypothetical protein
MWIESLMVLSITPWTGLMAVLRLSGLWRFIPRRPFSGRAVRGTG